MKRLILNSLCCFLLTLCFCSKIEAHEFPFEIKGEYAILMSLDDEQIIFEKNSDEKMYPASMTKVMTVYVALQHITNLDETITLNRNMFKGLVEANASVAGFEVGETVSLRDLLYGILLPSGADACRAIAYYVAGSEEAFVDLMNQQVKQMGLTKTHFVNTSGLHDDNHYTTAFEMAQIVKKAIENPIFLEMYETTTYTTSSTLHHPSGIKFMANAHRYALDAHLDDSLIQGSKTGFTDEGGMCLSSIASFNDMHFLMIEGQAGLDRRVPNHLIDTLHTYEYLKENYEKQQLSTEIIDHIEVKYHGEIPIQLDTLEMVLPHQANPQFVFHGHNEYVAPIEKGSELGEVEVVVDGEIVKTISVKANETIQRKGYLYVFSLLKENILWIVLILGVIGMIYKIKSR